MADMSIPNFASKGAPTTLETRGPVGRQYDHVKHPVETILQTAPKSEWALKLKQLEDMHGRPAALHRQMEASVLRQFQRAPGMKSSFTGLDTVLGLDDKLDVHDVFGDPFEEPERIVNVHL